MPLRAAQDDDAGADFDAGKDIGSKPAGTDAAVRTQRDADTAPPLMPPPSNVCVPHDETCNELDDDCNGVVDDVPSTTMDAANCGRCGHACAPHETCETGTCHPPIAPPIVDAGSPPMMTPMQPDPTPSCGGVECAIGRELGCCSEHCTDLTTNTNCGTCGKVCGLIGAGLTCSCELRDGAYGCYGVIGSVLSLCPR